MGWPFIAQNHATRPFGFAFGFAHHQHFDPRGEAVNLFSLCCDSIGQVIGDAHQMGDAFFKCGVIHAPHMRIARPVGKSLKRRCSLLFAFQMVRRRGSPSTSACPAGLQRLEEARHPSPSGN